jgi:hypothetical protein
MRSTACMKTGVRMNKYPDGLKNRNKICDHPGHLIDIMAAAWTCPALSALLSFRNAEKSDGKTKLDPGCEKSDCRPESPVFWA